MRLKCNPCANPWSEIDLSTTFERSLLDWNCKLHKLVSHFYIETCIIWLFWDTCPYNMKVTLLNFKNNESLSPLTNLCVIIMCTEITVFPNLICSITLLAPMEEVVSMFLRTLWEDSFWQHSIKDDFKFLVYAWLYLASRQFLSLPSFGMCNEISKRKVETRTFKVCTHLHWS